MTIEALDDSILFEFVDLTKNGYFRGHTTDWGFSMEGIEDTDANKSRWGKVLHVGPNVKYATVGEYILIEKQKWTLSIEIEGKTMWRTKEEFVEVTTNDISTIHR